MGEEKCAVCSQPATQRCGGCHVIYYCSRDHQKSDWKGHRDTCRPFKVAHNDVLGRHLVATRDIKPGEVLLKEVPLIAGPPQITAPVCLGCYKPLTSSTSVECLRCGWPLCSSKCAENPAHIPECRATSEWKKEKVSIRDFEISHPTYQSVTVLRCLYQRDYNPAVWNKLSSLESHCQHRRGTPKYEQDRVAIAKFIRRFFKVDSFSEDEILRVCGIVQVNGHEVPVTEPPHVAIYDTASMLEHHCRPNCSKSFTSTGVLLVHTAVPIRKGDHLSICYTDAMWGTANRRHHLHETKFFWCRCERCADPTEFGTYFSALRCHTSGCAGYVLPERPVGGEGTPDNDEEDLAMMCWKCLSCGTGMPSQIVFQVLEKVGSELASMEKGDPEACEQFLNKFGGERLLHPNHFYLTDVRLALAQLYGQAGGGLPTTSDKELERKIKLCLQLLALADVLVPAENRVRGVIMFELHAAVAEEARRKASRGEMDTGELRDRLLESKRLLTEAATLLQFEPPVLPEGQMAVQARKNLQDINTLLQGIHATIGDSPL
ncbi:SET domain-containing protein SmydA-8 [Anabrus simplex]|uniref:SET domain-containing protein SmydA-8 n=1 Tax=Anabrus simplex TaxID=316456 RepID=UPI0035A334CD